MKTILENDDIVLVSEFRPISNPKVVEMALHKRKVESIIIWRDKFDYNGTYLSTEKVIIDSYTLSRMRAKIDELESEEKIMETASTLPF